MLNDKSYPREINADKVKSPVGDFDNINQSFTIFNDLLSQKLQLISTQDNAMFNPTDIGLSNNNFSYLEFNTSDGRVLLLQWGTTPAIKNYMTQNIRDYGNTRFIVIGNIRVSGNSNINIAVSVDTSSQISLYRNPTLSSGTGAKVNWFTIGYKTLGGGKLTLLLFYLLLNTEVKNNVE